MKRKVPKVVAGIELWRCPMCEGYKPASGYYSDTRSANGLKAQCRTCHTAGGIRTRDEEVKRTNNRKHMRRARQKDPEKFRARWRMANRKRSNTSKEARARSMLNLAVARGEIVVPSACSDCSEDRKLQGHHEDYDRPLDVEWLCSECHGRRHRKPSACAALEAG